MSSKLSLILKRVHVDRKLRRISRRSMYVFDLPTFCDIYYLLLYLFEASTVFASTMCLK